ncbi:MAG: ferritin family protein [Thermodesulfobacteriota bacterium]|nr:ferritin family protein [Thermodesulfobacteriota bacterium]
MDSIFKSIKHVETVLELAVYMEQESRAFYRRWADTVEEESLRDLFVFLAREESDHARKYTEMLETAGGGRS